jgi:hypothetical protein
MSDERLWETFADPRDAELTRLRARVAELEEANASLRQGADIRDAQFVKAREILADRDAYREDWEAMRAWARRCYSLDKGMLLDKLDSLDEASGRPAK